MTLVTLLTRQLKRYAPTAALVALGHVGLLWALVQGMALSLPKPPETVVMASIISAPLVAPPEPEPVPVPPPPAPEPVVQPKPPKPQPLAVKPKKPQTQTKPQVQAQAEPELPVVQPDTSPVAAATAAPAPAAAATPGPVSDVVVKPSKADYLNNPKPDYPALSRRMGEEGKVTLRVLIGVAGHAEQVQVKKSSGYPRLDQAAQQAVRNWRFKPGTRNGQAEAMWFDVPVDFRLED